MRIEITGKVMHVVLTLEEAAIMKRTIQGDTPTDAGQRVLDRLCGSIERAQETARKKGLT